MSTLTDEEKEIVLDGMRCMQALNELGWLKDIRWDLFHQQQAFEQHNKILMDILGELVEIKERLK